MITFVKPAAFCAFLWCTLLGCGNGDKEEVAEAILPDPEVETDDVFAKEYWDNAELVWSDEFDGNSLDLEKWRYETGDHGWGNNELQDYVEGNTEVQDGILRIIAKRSATGEYTSARLNSRKSFTYGRLELRARIPEHKGNGIWPALWMLGSNIGNAGWPACGEIDIMEYVSYDPNKMHFSIHSTANNHRDGTQVTSGALPLDSIEEEFHNYGVLWTDKYLKFYIDEPENVKLNFIRPEPSNSANWPFSQPFYFLMNIAVGGDWGGQQGVDPEVFPAAMEVDYVRVYQVK